MINNRLAIGFLACRCGEKSFGHFRTTSRRVSRRARRPGDCDVHPKQVARRNPAYGGILFRSLKNTGKPLSRRGVSRALPMPPNTLEYPDLPTIRGSRKFPSFRVICCPDRKGPAGGGRRPGRTRQDIQNTYNTYTLVSVWRYKDLLDKQVNGVPCPSVMTSSAS